MLWFTGRFTVHCFAGTIQHFHIAIRTIQHRHCAFVAISEKWYMLLISKLSPSFLSLFIASCFEYRSNPLCRFDQSIAYFFFFFFLVFLVFREQLSNCTFYMIRIGWNLWSDKDLVIKYYFSARCFYLKYKWLFKRESGRWVNKKL